MKGIADSWILDSSYNAAPASMNRVIEFAKTLRSQLFDGYKLMLVLGDMRELGDFTEQEHRQLAGKAFNVADVVLVVGENMNKYFLDEFEKIGGKVAKGELQPSQLGFAK